MLVAQTVQPRRRLPYRACIVRRLLTFLSAVCVNSFELECDSSLISVPWPLFAELLVFAYMYRLTRAGALHVLALLLVRALEFSCPLADVNVVANVTFCKLARNVNRASKRTCTRKCTRLAQLRQMRSRRAVRRCKVHVELTRHAIGTATNALESQRADERVTACQRLRATQS